MVLFGGQRTSISSTGRVKLDSHETEDAATPRLLRISSLRHSHRMPVNKSSDESFSIDDSDTDSIVSAPAHNQDTLSPMMTSRKNGNNKCVK